VRGHYARRISTLARCSRCGYAFIADPWLEFERIYDERYYAGLGADPLLDYSDRLEDPVRDSGHAATAQLASARSEAKAGADQR
jgi:hypothetical protein